MFFAKKIKQFQSVYLVVQDKIVQNWIRYNSGISEKNTKSESFLLVLGPQGGHLPWGCNLVFITNILLHNAKKNEINLFVYTHLAPKGGHLPWGCNLVSDLVVS